MIRPIVFGKFVLLERISVGGMAEVYRAKLLDAPHFNRFLAIKRILPNLAADDEFIRMFIDEAKITVELNHPNICQIYELGRLEDSHYIAMEFIPGRDLLGIQNRYRRQKKIMSVSQACFITAQVAQGLDFAHRAVDSQGNPLSIIHRDVSPQNVLVSYEGLVKLIDFGVAKAASKNSKTQAGVLKGKFGYMSPEQVEGKGEVDHRSDIFALGTVFWELLTGRRLFHGSNEFATLGLVRECNVKPPSELNKLVPAQVEQVCMRALCPDPQYRYQWAGELARDLWQFLNSCNPPYTQWHLQNWMCQNFAEDLETEWEKLPVMQSINTVEDVRRFNEAELAKAEAEMQAKMAQADQTQEVYDFEGNVVPELEDIEDFEGERTQVFTPEFDFTEEMEAPDTQADAKLPRPPGMPPPEEDTSKPEVEQVTNTPSDPMHQSIYQMDAYEYAPEPSRGYGGIIAILLLLILIGGAGFAGWFFFLRTQETEAGPTAPTTQLKVSVSPEAPGIVVNLLDETGSNVLESADGTPVTFDELEPGPYMLKVSQPGYEPETRSVTLGENPGTAEVLMTNKLETLGKVELKVTPPDASVEVDGETLEGGGSPRTLKLPVDREHTLVIKARGHKPIETTVTPKEGDTVPLEVELEKGVGVVKVSSNAKGAVVYYFEDEDWQKIGRVPATIRDLDPTKSHKIKVRHKDYGERELDIEFNQEGGPFEKSILARMKKK